MSSERRFILDRSLGRLAKWMRILGFDSRCCTHGSDHALLSAARGSGRILVTRITRCRDRYSGEMVFIRHNGIDAQIGQVIAETGITAGEIRLFSRCIRCNVPVLPLPREAVRTLVPAYVWSTAARFHRCPSCGRIYWPGTHAHRISGRIQKLFPRHEMGEGDGSQYRQ